MLGLRERDIIWNGQDRSERIWRLLLDSSIGGGEYFYVNVYLYIGFFRAGVYCITVYVYCLTNMSVETTVKRATHPKHNFKAH